MIRTPLLLENVGLALLCLDGAEDDVHLFEGASLRLGNESMVQIMRVTTRWVERGDVQSKGRHATDVDGSEHDEELEAQGGNHGGRHLGEHEVEEPLRR